MFSLHIASPREVARAILARGDLHRVIAVANALQVDVSLAVTADIDVILEYLEFPDSGVRSLCLHNIAFLGQKREFRATLVNAAAAVEVNGDAQVAVALVDVFSPNHLGIATLSDAKVEHILTELAPVEDFSIRQGAIPSFLSSLVTRFPDRRSKTISSRLSPSCRNTRMTRVSGSFTRRWHRQSHPDMPLTQTLVCNPNHDSADLHALSALPRDALAYIRERIQPCLQKHNWLGTKSLLSKDP